MARQSKAAMSPDDFRRLIACLEGNRAAHAAYQAVFEKKAEQNPVYVNIARLNRTVIADYDEAINEARSEYAKGGRK